jgi:hypothetical protein
MDPIIAGPFRVRQRRLEKTFGPEAIRSEALLFFSRENDAHFFCVGPKDAHYEIVPHAMRPKHPEWIGMRAGEENV